MTYDAEPGGPTRIAKFDHLAMLDRADRLVIRQLKGAGENREFKVLPLQEVIIGRGENTHIRIDELGVSRFHAKIVYTGDMPWIEDMGSTNGIFVNRKKAARQQLMDGDIFQICSAEFCVALVTSEAGFEVEQVNQVQLDQFTNRLKTVKRQPDRPRKSLFTGDLQTINMPSLLQILQVNGSSGTVVIRSDQHQGEVVIDDGRIVHAELGVHCGKKAFFRIAGMENGHFDFYSPSRLPGNPSLNHHLQELLMQAMVQFDELPIYRKELPDDEVPLMLNREVAVLMHKFPADVFDVLAALSRHPTVAGVLEHTDLADLPTCRILLMLLKQKVIVVGEAEIPLELQTGQNLACRVETLKLKDPMGANNGSSTDE